MTKQQLFELRVVIARALSAEPDAGKRKELRDQLEALKEERDRLLNIASATLVAELEKPIQRVEQIVKELENEDILDALNRIQVKLKLPKLAGTTTSANVPEPSQPETDTAIGTISASSVVPDDWMPNVTMDRVICHWTAGGYKAGGLDQFSYHILIEGDGILVRGRFSIADNVSNLIWNPRSYAAHTAGTNTRSIGVSVCSMSGAHAGPPLVLGPSPMLKLQWDRMIEVTAQLCKKYSIPVSPTTILGHGEVQANLGNPQSGKWDPLVLPWDLSISKADTGNLLRQGVTDLLGS